MDYKKIYGKIFLNNNNNKRQVLCIGQVQSGKTRYIIEESEKAITLKYYDCIIVIGGINNSLLEQTEKRFKDNNKLKQYNHFNLSKGFEIKNLVLRNNKIIIYTLKGKDALEKVKIFVKNNREFKYLIIDDESDYGSLDVSKNGKGSKIYELISSLFDLSYKCDYFSVTATPFANILGKSWSFNEIRYIPPSDNYCGIDFFRKNKYIYETCDNLIIKNNIDEKKLTEILIDHIKRITENNILKSQLLINISLNTEKQDWVIKKIRESLICISKIIKRFIDENKVEKSINVLKQLHTNLLKFNYHSTQEEIGKFNKNHCIIVGGNMVSRGLTFENLVTCIMINEPNDKYSADTLLQRCRWFGYRRKKIKNSKTEHYKIMKVFITSNIMNCLEEAKILNDIIISNSDIEKMKKKIKLQNLKHIVPSQKSKNEMKIYEL